MAPLAKAMGARRFIEPRVTGGFQHARLVVLRSGDAPQGLDAQPPAVLAAVAQIRERAEADTSPETLGAVAVTYLVSGDAGAAVKALESATAQAPDNARLWSDLAAAYLVRASRLDEPADIPKALEAAERAIALKDPPLEAWFNRALALESLHLGDAARKAWEDYLQRDAASGWADEARQHLEARPKVRQSTVEEDRARVKAALAEGPAAVDRLADEAPSLLRNYFDDDLLPAWAEAHLVGHPDENLHREHARLLGDALLRVTGDAMARDTAQGPGHSSSPGHGRTRRDITRLPASPGPRLRRPQGSQAPLRPPGAGVRAVPRRRPRPRKGAKPVRGLGPATGRRRLLLLLGSGRGHGRIGAPGARRPTEELRAAPGPSILATGSSPRVSRGADSLSRSVRLGPGFLPKDAGRGE